jgi:hypothetical protein
MEEIAKKARTCHIKASTGISRHFLLCLECLVVSLWAVGRARAI